MIFSLCPVIYTFGYIMNIRAAEEIWFVDKVQGWPELVKIFSGVARKHLQSAYTGL